MPMMRKVTSGPSAIASMGAALATGSPARRAPKLLRRLAAAAGKVGGAYEVEADGVAGVEREALGEHEARDRLVCGGRVCGPTRAKVLTFHVATEAVVGGQHRKQVDGPNAAAVTGTPGEHEGHSGARG